MAVRITRVVSVLYVLAAVALLLTFGAAAALSDGAPGAALPGLLLGVGFPLLVGWALWKEGGTARSVFSMRRRR